MKANIDVKKISGNDRAVVWDGETRSGPDLHNQLDAIAENRVPPFLHYFWRGHFAELRRSSKLICVHANFIVGKVC